MCSTIMQSLTFITMMLSEKISVLKFHPAKTLDQSKTNNLSPSNTHQSCTVHILYMIFLMYVAAIQHLNYSTKDSKHKSKKHKLQSIFLTPVTLKHSQGLQT